MKQRHSWLALVMLAVGAGCTTTDDSDVGDVVFLVSAFVEVCAPETEGDIRDCTSALMPFGEVTITSGSEVVWEGELGIDGRVEARFSATQDFVVTVTSPFVPEDLQSDPISLDAPDVGVDLHTRSSYTLTLLDMSSDDSGG